MLTRSLGVLQVSWGVGVVNMGSIMILGCGEGAAKSNVVVAIGSRQRTGMQSTSSLLYFRKSQTTNTIRIPHTSTTHETFAGIVCEYSRGLERGHERGKGHGYTSGLVVNQQKKKKNKKNNKKKKEKIFACSRCCSHSCRVS